MKPRLFFIFIILLFISSNASGKKILTETSTVTWFIYPQSLGTPPAGWITNPAGVSSAWVPAGIDPCTWAPSATPTSQRILGSTFTSALSTADAYFYTTFIVDSLKCLGDVILTYNADDSAYFTLNGTLIEAGGDRGYRIYTKKIPNSVFVAGKNVLTVHLKNKAPGCFFVQAELSSSGNIISRHTNISNCTGIPMVLHGVKGASSYIWQDSSTLDSFVTSTMGIFWVKSNDLDYCNVVVDSFVISPKPDTVKSTRTVKICNNIPTIIKPMISPTSASYLWNTGSLGNSITISKTGTYWVAVQELCRLTLDTIVVQELQISASIQNKDTMMCEGDTIQLFCTANPPTSTILWSTGDTTTTIVARAAGKYSIFAMYEGCKASDDVEILKAPLIAIDLGEDKEICAGDVLQLPRLVTSELYDKYLWQDGSSDRKYYVTKAGTYTVQVIGKCNTIYDTVNITTRNCRLLFPDVFSPNGDGRNDIAHMFGDIANVSMFELHIYHRWGQEVFVSKDIMKGWDGTHNGIPAGQDTYNYYIKYRYFGKDEIMKGTLILLR